MKTLEKRFSSHSPNLTFTVNNISNNILVHEDSVPKKLGYTTQASADTYVAGTLENTLGLHTRARLRSNSPPLGIKHNIPFPTVEVNTKTQAITSRYYLCIHQDRIWIKTRPKSEGGLEDSGTDLFSDWTLLPPYAGLPKLSEKDEKDPRFAEPTKIVEISADGWNLVAIADNGRAYYFKLLDTEGKFIWQGKWGKPNGEWISIPKDVRCWAIGHRHNDAEYFEDIDGNKHYGTAGVTSLYILSKDGNKLSYIDPWIPATFYAYRAEMPRRNKFVAEHFATGGSLCCVIDRTGAMYTRMIDYDVNGENPLITYSYQRGKHDTNKIDNGFYDWVRAKLGSLYGEVKEVVTMPAVDWKEQPRLPAGCKVDPRTLTVIQTGKGNASRELRIEGINEDEHNGYFYKMLNDDHWQFKPYTDLYRIASKIHVVEFVPSSEGDNLPPSRHLYDRTCQLEYRSRSRSRRERHRRRSSSSSSGSSSDNDNRRVVIRLKNFNPWVMQCTVEIVVLRNRDNDITNNNDDDEVEERRYEFDLYMRRARMVPSKRSKSLLSTLNYDKARTEFADPWCDNVDVCIKYRGMLSIPNEIFRESECSGCDILRDVLNGLKKNRANAQISYERDLLDQTHVLIPVSVFYDSANGSVDIREKFITKWPQAYLDLPLAVHIIREPIKWRFTELRVQQQQQQHQPTSSLHE